MDFLNGINLPIIFLDGEIGREDEKSYGEHHSEFEQRKRKYSFYCINPNHESYDVYGDVNGQARCVVCKGLIRGEVD